MKFVSRLATAWLVLTFGAGQALAADADDLRDLLNKFLATTYTQAAHASFWADDLVYTSSAGLRFGKADIMASFEGAEVSNPAPDTLYSADEIDIRVYGETAVVAFKLVGEPTAKTDDAMTEYYFNTGTFLKRDGVWRVIAWQATEIPPVT